MGIGCPSRRGSDHAPRCPSGDHRQYSALTAVVALQFLTVEGDHALKEQYGDEEVPERIKGQPRDTWDRAFVGALYVAPTST
jgi:hypothetical protein